MKVLISNQQGKTRLNTPLIARDCRLVLGLLGLGRAELSLLFETPAGMRKLNLKYRGIDKTTDVLSFPLYESKKDFPRGGPFAIGDVVIDPLRAKEQAEESGISLREEIVRLITHGALHLMGYDHERSDYHKRKMRSLENKAIRSIMTKTKEAT